MKRRGIAPYRPPASIQQDPLLGGTPTERTEVRVLFNSTTLFMGVTCFDSEPGKLLGNTMKRDEFLGADDRFMWTWTRLNEHHAEEARQ